MATKLDFVNYVVEQISDAGEIRYRKMFGEYMVYVNEKPIILICDDIPYVKKLDCVSEIAPNLKTGIPYPNAKEWYILDIDDSEKSEEIVRAIEKVTVVKEKKKKKK